MQSPKPPNSELPDYVGDSRYGRFPIQPRFHCDDQGKPVCYEGGIPTLTSIMEALLDEQWDESVVVGSMIIPRKELEDREWKTGKPVERGIITLPQYLPLDGDDEF